MGIDKYCRICFEFMSTLKKGLGIRDFLHGTHRALFKRPMVGPTWCLDSQCFCSETQTHERKSQLCPSTHRKWHEHLKTSWLKDIWIQASGVQPTFHTDAMWYYLIPQVSCSGLAWVTVCCWHHCHRKGHWNEKGCHPWVFSWLPSCGVNSCLGWNNGYSGFPS